MTGTPYAAGGDPQRPGRGHLGGHRRAAHRATLPGLVAGDGRQGTTTVEIKSGYGLITSTTRPGASPWPGSSPVETTYLGAHVVPEGDAGEYVASRSPA